MEEQHSLEEQGTWEVHETSSLPKGRKTIGSHWVFTVKLNEDGSIKRYKARLVVKGYAQIFQNR